MNPGSVQLLGPQGPFAQGLAGYEARAGQLEMAHAVERVLADDGILLCEAGTGTGKTLAYLVPAILSGRRVIVSTATRALQEQIASHDIPLVSRVLGIEPRVSIMKGLSNYICRRRLAEFCRDAASLQPRYASALNALEEWLPTTLAGDIAEVESLPEDAAVWSHVTASSDTRIGSECPYHEDCFVTRMRRAADQSQIVIVNHHLFFADLALRGPHPGRVIPDYDAVVFDEGHQLEDTATLFFGFRVSRLRIDALLSDATRAISGADDESRVGEAEWRAVLAEVRRAADRFWAVLRDEVAASGGRTTVEPGIWAGEANDAWLDLDDSLQSLGSRAATTVALLENRESHHAVAAIETVERRAEMLRDQLANIVESVRGHVVWFESDPRNCSLAAAPVDLSGVFRERIFDAVSAAVVTSATLTSTVAGGTSTIPGGGSARGDFTFLRSRLGLSGDLDVEELAVASPFDFASNALLYTPTDLPEPQNAQFLGEAAERVRQLVELSDGGAFVLTTSIRSMNILSRELRQRCPGRLILLQGDAPKRTLIEGFRLAGDAVLVATMGFWEGVDVPGSALRLVILEKIPFPVPTDPIVKARSMALEAEGRNPFMELHVPSAAISLKQGFGRLIRTRVDSGVVALLDERIRRRGYGKRLLAVLPPARQVDDLADVAQFWSARFDSDRSSR